MREPYITEAEEDWYRRFGGRPAMSEPFGPLAPIPPLPVDDVPGSPRPEPRKWMYPFGCLPPEPLASSNFTIPGDLIVTVWREPEGLGTSLPARDILATPTSITATYKSNAIAATPERGIRLSFGMKLIAGQSFEGTNGMATLLAGHAAAMDEDWPGATASVRLYPVVDFTLTYQVVPGE